MFKVLFIYHKAVSKGFEDCVQECIDCFKGSDFINSKVVDNTILPVDYDYIVPSEAIEKTNELMRIINGHDIIIILSPDRKYTEENHSTAAWVNDTCVYIKKMHYVVSNVTELKDTLGLLMENAFQIDDKEVKPAICNVPKREKILILSDICVNNSDKEWYNYINIKIDELLTPIGYSTKNIYMGKLPNFSNIDPNFEVKRYTYFLMSKIKEADVIILLNEYEGEGKYSDMFSITIEFIKAFVKKKIICIDYGCDCVDDIAGVEIEIKAALDSKEEYGQGKYLEWMIGGNFNE